MSDWFQAEEQALILPVAPGSEGGKLVASPYGGFILPGSTFDAFHIAVSQWYDPQNYRVMQYRIDGLQS